MKKRKSIKVNGYLKRICIGILINIIIVVAICLIKSSYRTVQAFSTGLFYIGAINIVAGLFSLIGNMQFRGNASYQVTRTAGIQSSKQRIQEDLDGTEKSFKFVVYMSIVGILIMGLSAIVQYIIL